MGNAKGINKNEVLSASEIGQYQYCSYAWMLQRSGYEPDSPSLNEGKQFHVKLGETIDDYKTSNSLAQWIILAGLLLFCIAISLIFIEVIL